MKSSFLDKKAWKCSWLWKTNVFCIWARFPKLPVLGRRGESLHFYSVFVVFHQKCKSLRSQFSQMLVAVSLATRAKKRAILIGNLQGFLIFRKKRACLQSPFWSGGGGGSQPQETQKGPNPCIFTVFSCLAQNQKKGLATGSQEAKLGTFWSPKSQGEALYLQFYSVFSSWQAENLHFYMVLGLWDTCREQPGTQRERNKHNFTCIFAGFSCLGWKGERMIGWKQPREIGKKGSWEPGFWDFEQS